MVETAEAAGPVPSAEPVEAVIISGPRRGEIIRLPADAIPELSDEEIKLVDEALDMVDAALGRFESTVESAIARFSAPPGTA
jgi:hypothetical protein